MMAEFLTKFAREEKAKEDLYPFIKYVDQSELPELLRLADESSAKSSILNGLMESTGINAITGKSLEVERQERLEQVESAGQVVQEVFEYLKGNVMGQAPEGKLAQEQIGQPTQRKRGEESLYAEPKHNIEIGEVGPYKGIGGAIFRKFFPKSAKKTKEISDAMPKYAGSVNLQRQDIPRDLKLAELRVSEGLKKTPLTWNEVDAKSLKILEDPRKVQDIVEMSQAGIPLGPIEQDVLRRINIDELHKFQTAMKAAKTPQETAEIMSQYREPIFIPTSQSARLAGQTLNVFRKDIGLTRLDQAFKKLGRNMNPREMKEFKDLPDFKSTDPNDIASVKAFAGRLGNPKLKDYFYEYWYNSILSGVPTHVVNVASNTAWRAFQVPHRALTSGVDALISVFTGAPRNRFLGESIPMMAGFVKGKPKAAASAWDMMRHGRLTNFETKWAQEMGSSIGAFDRSPSKTIRGIGKVVTVPTKALRTMDVYANSLAYDGQMAALAKRTWKLNKQGSFKEFKKKFVEDPPDWAHKDAMEFAKYTTFMSDPGKFSEWVMKGRDIVPGGRLVVPFVNTIGNLLKRGIEMTPGPGTLYHGYKFVKGTGGNASEAIAKQIEGAVLTALVYKKIEDGDLVGSAPKNPTEREAFYRQNKKAWSMKVGDNYYQYRRVEPFNTVLASAQIGHDGIKQALSEDNEKDATEIFTNVATEFKNNLIDSSYLQGVTQLLNRHGTLEDMPKRIGSSLIPFSGFWRSVNRSYEAHVEGSAKYRPSDTWVSAMAGVIPGLYDQVSPKVTVWGEEVELEGGVFRQWLPYKWSKKSDDKTEDFLETLGVYPGLPSQVVKHKGTSFRLDDDIYRDFVITVGSSSKKIMDKQVDGIWGRAVSNPKHHNNLRKSVDKLLSSQRRLARNKAIKLQLQRGTAK